MRLQISLSVIIAILAASVSLLELCHHAYALGVDSTSHGLLSGGRVVRRYGNFGGGNLFNKRYSVRLRGLQERADPPKEEPPKGDEKKGDDKKDDDKKDDKKGDQKEPKKVPVPNAPEPEISEKEPVKQPVKEPAKDPAKDPEKDPSDTDTTTANQDQASAPATDAGTPTVPTGSISSGAVLGLVSVGGVFVLVAGLFAFSKRRKNKEMTKNIMNNSAKAWEQQNSTYEKMEEEETNPIGSYTVIATYTPTLSDELDIQPGDKVTILVEFDDGWVQGINETRGGTKGVFPRHCVDMDHIASSNINNKRSSSIGLFAERYTEVDLN